MWTAAAEARLRRKSQRMAYRIEKPMHLIWIIHLDQGRHRPGLVNCTAWSL
jgi:hypothetical protein